MAEKKPRGFAGMDPTKQREIASKGGKAAHQKGTAHKFTPEEAAEAGRKGGKAAHARGTAHQFTPQEASAAGRKGGRAAHVKNASRQENGEPRGEADRPAEEFRPKGQAAPAEAPGQPALAVPEAPPEFP